jgi:hypothetical protein
MSQTRLPVELRLQILRLARERAFRNRIERFAKRYASRSIWLYKCPDGGVCLNGDDKCRFSTYVSSGPLGGTRVRFDAYHCACQETSIIWNVYGIWRGYTVRNNFPCQTCRPKPSSWQQVKHHFTSTAIFALGFNVLLWALLGFL